MGRQGLVFNRDRVQRKIVLAANSLGAAMLGDRREPLGKVGPRPEFFCLAVKRNLTHTQHFSSISRLARG